MTTDKKQDFWLGFAVALYVGNVAWWAGYFIWKILNG